MPDLLTVPSRAAEKRSMLYALACSWVTKPSCACHVVFALAAVPAVPVAGYIVM